MSPIQAPESMAAWGATCHHHKSGGVRLEAQREPKPFPMPSRQHHLLQGRLIRLCWNGRWKFSQLLPFAVRTDTLVDRGFAHCRPRPMIAVSGLLLEPRGRSHGALKRLRQ